VKTETMKEHKQSVWFKPLRLALLCFSRCGRAVRGHGPASRARRFRSGHDMTLVVQGAIRNWKVTRLTGGEAPTAHGGFNLSTNGRRWLGCSRLQFGRIGASLPVGLRFGWSLCRWARDLDRRGSKRGAIAGLRGSERIWTLL
jgi:hypothetical protein